MRVGHRFVLLWFLCIFASPMFAGRTRPLNGTPTQRLTDLAAKKGRIPVIVGVRDDDWRPEGTLAPSAVQAQRARGKQKKADLLADHPDVEQVKDPDLTTVPYFVAWVKEKELRKLLDDDRVASIEEDLEVELALAESIPKVGADVIHNRQPVSYDGTGQIIVVIDYGVDHTHPFLAGRVLHEHAGCFSTANWTPPPNDPVTDPVTTCPNGQGTQIGPEAGALYAGMPCVGGDMSSAINACYHGTKAAGIATGSRHSGGPEIAGVAPGASIIPIQIAAKTCAAPSCSTFSRQSNVLYALDHVGDDLVNAYGRRIAAVSISLGFPQVTYGTRAQCDQNHPSFRDLVLNLAQSRDIAVVVATGNAGLSGAATLPSCVTHAIAVSATTDTDHVAYYANTADFVDLFAPGGADTANGDAGTTIYTSTPQNIGDLGTRNDDYTGETSFGTSWSAPHVAGAFAVLRQRDPSASVQTLLGYLVSTGTVLTHERAYGKPRININLALEQIPPPNPPSNFAATGNAVDSVQTTWNASTSPDVTYRLRFRSTKDGAWTDVAETPSTSYLHTGRTTGTTYQYDVTTLSESGEPSTSLADYAVTRPHTDDPIVSGSTVIRGIHIGELREAADGWRRFAGLDNAFGTYGAATGVVTAAHFTDIMAALNDARLALALSAFQFSGVAAPQAGGLIRREQVQQLRDAVN